MFSSTATIFTGLTVGGAVVGAYVWSKPTRGLLFGMGHSIVAIGTKELLGKKASAVYFAGIAIYTLGLIGREVFKCGNKETSNVSKIETVSWTNQARLKIYKETIGLIEQGYYMNGQSKKVILHSGDTLYRKSECFDTETAVSIPPNDLTTQIIVVKQDCLEAAQERVAKGHKVVVVNFASHDNPGGNSDRGTNGQEEDLCYRSELAGFMQDQIVGVTSDREQFYPLEEHPQRKDHLIHTPDVQVFRASRAHSYAILDHPFLVGIITSAAPVKPLLNGKEIVDYAKEEDRQRIRASMITQLYAAYNKGYDTVILGAFGCGAYQNPPQAVAKLYKEVIDSFFKKTFQHIVFAILDDPTAQGRHNPTGNFKPFEECFGMAKTLP